jgi:FkbM family methyltransferase
MIQYALTQARRIAANSKFGLQFAAKLRNQCEMIIGGAHGWPDCDLETNGEAKWLKSVADRLRYVVDVGANKGEWTDLALHHIRPDGVLLFEPSTHAAQLLRERFSERSEIEIVEAAAGNAPGSMLFFEEEGAGETSSLVEGVSSRGVARAVRVTTVDDEIERRGWPFVDFLKIDAEGYDFRVLEGTRRLFESARVAYGQFEYNGPWRLNGATLTYAILWLKKLGYQCFLLKADGLHIPDVDIYREYYLYSNYAIIRNDLVEDALHKLKRV